MMNNRFFSGISSPLPFLGRAGVSLLLALCCSAGLWAQTTKDPFPKVDEHKYSMSMTIVCKVKMGEEILKEAQNVTIAVYQGDEIRGKDVLADYSTSNNSYPDMCMLTIYGDKNNEPLYFKVAIDQRVIEVDQNLVYGINDSYGTRKAPYWIELPEPVVTNSSSEGWSTTCLPFNAEIPDGVTVYAATGVEDSQLKVAKYEGKVLPANTPVLVESAGGNSFEWLARISADEKPDVNIFLGTTEKTDVEAGTVYTLGHESSTGKIGFWHFTGTAIPANRAYLKLDGAGVKGFTWIEDDTDGVGLTPDPSPMREGSAGAVYDLSGRRVADNSSTLPRGIYVKNGQKIVVK